MFLVRKHKSDPGELIDFLFDSPQWVLSNFFIVKEDAHIELAERLGLWVYPIFHEETAESEEGLSELVGSFFYDYFPELEYRGAGIYLRKQNPNSSTFLDYEGNYGLLVGGRQIIVFGPQHNREDTDLLYLLKRAYYGNSFLMGSMISYHEKVFGKPIQLLLDPFLGHGGTLIAGIRHGVSNIVGIEIHPGNFVMAKSNLEAYLTAKNISFSAKTSNQKATYLIRPEGDGPIKAYLYRANTFTDFPRISEELCDLGIDFRSADLVSDLPWGPVKCLAHDGHSRIESPNGMARFYESFARLINLLRIPRMTLAINKKDSLLGLCLEQELFLRRKIYKLVSYSQGQ